MLTVFDLKEKSALGEGAVEIVSIDRLSLLAVRQLAGDAARKSLRRTSVRTKFRAESTQLVMVGEVRLEYGCPVVEVRLSHRIHGVRLHERLRWGLCLDREARLARAATWTRVLPEFVGFNFTGSAPKVVIDDPMSGTAPAFEFD